MSRLQNQLLVIKPDPLLVQRVDLLKKETIKARNFYQSQLDTVNTILNTAFSWHPALLEQVADLKRRIQLLTKGVPATEALENSTVLTDNQQGDVAHTFLLKKAYRQAALLAHPDKGGSNEDFAAVNAAYKAGDLHSLNEYVIAQNKTLFEQLIYWKTEALKPEAQWHKARSQPEFTIVRLMLSNQKPKAKMMAKEVLQILVASLTMQLTNYQPKKEEAHV